MKPKSLLSLLSKDSCQNFCVSHMQKCADFITLNGYNWERGWLINCCSINILYSLLCNSNNSNTTYIGKTVYFTTTMNNHITGCHYRTSTNKFEYPVVKRNYKNQARCQETFFKFYSFMTVNNENKLLLLEFYVQKMGFDIMNFYMFYTLYMIYIKILYLT